MDGTIVDTERYWIAAEHALVEAHGGTWSHEQAMQLVGQSLTFSAGILQAAGHRMKGQKVRQRARAPDGNANIRRGRIHRLAFR